MEVSHYYLKVNSEVHIKTNRCIHWQSNFLDHLNKRKIDAKTHRKITQILQLGKRVVLFGKMVCDREVGQRFNLIIP